MTQKKKNEILVLSVFLANIVLQRVHFDLSMAIATVLLYVHFILFFLKKI